MRLTLLALALLLPFALEDYSLYRVTLAAVYALAILGLGLLIGLSGQFSVGHGAFFAAGAYGLAIPMSYGWSAYAALPFAGTVGFVLGIVVGLPARRLNFVQQALVTWGLALAVPQLLKSRWLERWTNGVQGIYIDRPGAPAGIDLSDDQWWYLVTIVVLAICLHLAKNLSEGRGARALKALRDHPIAAAASGVSAARYKPLIFGISAGFTALAGALAALLTDFVAPDAYGVFFSILLLIGAVAGGVGSVWGAVPGGLLVQYLPDAAADASAALSFPAYGLILIVLMYFMPGGAAGMVHALHRRVSKRQAPAHRLEAD